VLNSSECAACNSEHCAGHSTIGDMGCNNSNPSNWIPWPDNECCGRGVPLPASSVLPNCLLIGDSTTDGQSGLVAAMLKNECQTQAFIGITAAYEALCWGAHAASAVDGKRIPFDVIHFNEGLHSLWPRTNTTDASGALYAAQLRNWTAVLAAPYNGVTPSLIYATMTPMMAAHWCNPPGDPQNTVELLNALAVRTVQAAGVTHIHDAYTTIRNACGGALYSNCSLCDNESMYACDAYKAAGGICGFHFSSQGWEVLANSTANSIRAVLAERRADAAAAAAAATVAGRETSSF